MGHHPPIGVQQVPTQATTTGGMTPVTWILILVGIAVLAFVVYYTIQIAKGSLFLK